MKVDNAVLEAGKVQALYSYVVYAPAIMSGMLHFVLSRKYQGDTQLPAWVSQAVEI